MLYLPVHDVSILPQVLKDIHNLRLPLLIEYAKGTEVCDALNERVGEELTGGRPGRRVLAETLREDVVELLGPVEAWGWEECEECEE